MEGIGKNTDDLHHIVEIDIGGALRNPEASKQSIPVVGIIDEGIAPICTIIRFHVWLSWSVNIFVLVGNGRNVYLCRRRECFRWSNRVDV